MSQGWVSVRGVQVRQSGAWKQVTDVYVRQNNLWIRVFGENIPTYTSSYTANLNNISGDMQPYPPPPVSYYTVYSGGGGGGGDGWSPPDPPTTTTGTGSVYGNGGGYAFGGGPVGIDPGLSPSIGGDPASQPDD